MYSTPDETTKLPLQFVLIHDFCCDLIMDVVPFLVDPKYPELRNLSINIDNDIAKEIKDLDSLQLLEWIKNNNFKKEYEKYFLISVFENILADFAEYIEFSLIASRRSRLNVALNLVRKPFLENLMVFEQLLSKPDEFINNFTNKNPEKYNPVNEQNKKGVIEKCIKEIGNGNFFNTNLIYTLRYDKNNSSSYYALSNKAVHLVTTRNKSYETSEKSFNLVFVPESNYIKFWTHYYNFIPLLLYYSVEVIEAIVKRETNEPKEEFLFRKFSRLIGFLFITELLNPEIAKTHGSIDKFSGKFSLVCPTCEKENKLFKSDYHEIFISRTLCCKHCLTNMIENKETLNEFYKLFNLKY